MKDIEQILQMVFRERGHPEYLHVCRYHNKLEDDGAGENEDEDWTGRVRTLKTEIAKVKNSVDSGITSIKKEINKVREEIQEPLIEDQDDALASGP